MDSLPSITSCLRVRDRAAAKMPIAAMNLNEMQKSSGHLSYGSGPQWGVGLSVSTSIVEVHGGDDAKRGASVRKLYRVTFDNGTWPVEVGSTSERTSHTLRNTSHWHWGVGIMPLVDHGGHPPSGERVVL